MNLEIEMGYMPKTPVTDALMRQVGERVGERMHRFYEKSLLSNPETSGYGGIIRNAGRSPLRKLALAVILSYQVSGCGVTRTPTNPSDGNNGGMQTIQGTAYNSTTGQSKPVTFTVQDGMVTAVQLGEGLGDVVNTEFAVRTTDGDIGTLVKAAGNSTSLGSGSYDFWVPASNGRYDCMPNVSLNGGKRNFVVGVLHKPGVDTNGLPMYVWTDAINELNRHMQSDNGRRYGSIRFDANATNPDFTVGFANEGTAPAWAEGYRHAYMMGPKSTFPFDYDRATVHDSAIEELFEMIFAVNNICGPATRETIGKALQSGDTEWGLNVVGVNLLRRNFTRAK